MAFSNPINIAALGNDSGITRFFVDRRRPCKVINVTKASGDTSGTVDCLMPYVKKVIVLKGDGTLDTTAVATAGYGSNGANFSSSLSSLTTGQTSIYVIAIGGRN